MVSGECLVERGKFRMVSGEWRAESREWLAVNVIWQNKGAPLYE